MPVQPSGPCPSRANVARPVRHIERNARSARRQVRSVRTASASAVGSLTAWRSAVPGALASHSHTSQRPQRRRASGGSPQGPYAQNAERPSSFTAPRTQPSRSGPSDPRLDRSARRASQRPVHSRLDPVSRPSGPCPPVADVAKIMAVRTRHVLAPGALASLPMRCSLAPGAPGVVPPRRARPVRSSLTPARSPRAVADTFKTSNV
jgi:hypothetical protein